MLCQDETEWRCRTCQRKLGVIAGDTVFVRHGSRRPEYAFPRPGIATCGACRTMNSTN